MSKTETQQATPRWLYSLISWAERTPIKTLGVAIAYYLASGVLLHVVNWAFEGRAPEFDASLFFPGIYFTILLFFWHWMNTLAESSINTFGHGIRKSNSETKAIYIDFISVAELHNWILLLVAVPLGIIYTQQFMAQFGFTHPGSIAILALVVLPSSLLQVLSMFRIVRQLLQLDSLYKDVKDINLFSLGPIYALSRYSYRFALLGVLAIAIIDTLSILRGEPLDVLTHTISATLIIVMLVAPTLGISGRLRAEKEKDMLALGTQLNGLYDETNAAIKSRRLKKVPALNAAITAMEKQMEKVQKVGTLPWDPGSLRTLLLPILLPLVIAILQRYVLAWLQLQ